jgi:hypothetical protein
MGQPKSTLVQSDVAQEKRQRVTRNELLFAIVAAIAVIAAIVSFALYNSGRVPAGTAAKVNDSYLSEERVAGWIAQYRTAYSLEDDTDFARSLLAQGLTPAAFRQNAINQLALDDLVSGRAAELGITPSEDEVQTQIDAMKQTMAFNDDEVLEETLAGYGMSVESLRLQYLSNLKRQAVFEADVARREASEDELLDFIGEYLASTTQKHTSRIIFAGDDAYERARECHEQLSELQAAGEFDADAFAVFAREYSDEEGVELTGGAYTWSSGDAMDTEIMTLLEFLEIGSFTGPESIEADGAIEIIYCDEEYAFPSQAEISSLAIGDVPPSLMELIEDAAVEAVWTADCNVYLASLLAQAQITYYPVPADAAYAVDLSLAAS